MAYRFKVGNDEYETDTPEEAIKMRAALRLVPTDEKKRAEDPPLCDGWWAFVRRLAPSNAREQRRLLSIIKRSGTTPMTRDELLAALGFASGNMIGGTLGGVSKNAQKCALDIDQLILRSGDTYTAGPLLMEKDLPWDDVPKTPA